MAKRFMVPNIGDCVRVWPRPDLVGLVSTHPPPTTHRPIPAEGADLVWSRHLAQRFAAGELLLTDPNPPAAKALASAADDLPPAA